MPVVYNGVDLNDVPFSDRPDDFFLIVGRMVPGKGIADAIRIAARAKVKLLIVGHVTSHLPWSEEYFLKEVKPHIDGDKVRHIERLSHRDLTRIMSRAKGFLFPIAWDEPFGMVVIEAMAAGAPVLAYARGSMPELIKNGETGYLVQSEDEMIDGLQRLYAVDRARCRHWVRERFSVEQMIDGYERLYKSAARGPRRQSDSSLQDAP
jgi:glycosyltransferase involved in cell wall biosynthesis